MTEDKLRDLLIHTNESPTGCLLWNRCRLPKGYGKLKYATKGWLAHRLAWTFAFGPIPEGMAVCHRCDTPPCINPAHLFLGTQQDNLEDMRAKGRLVNVVGEASPHAKLTEQAVREMRRSWSLGAARKELVANFGVSSSTVDAVLNRRTWRHVA